MIGWLSKLIKRPKTYTLENDPRWRAFHDSTTPCACCGQSFDGVFDIGFDHPDPWPHGNWRDQHKEAIKVGDDVLGGDLCTIGKDRFVRGVLRLPIIGAETHFAFGVWCSLKPENFESYVDAYGTEKELELPHVFGWMSNALPYYDNKTFVETHLVFQGDKTRPHVIVNNSGALHHDQNNGISFDKLLDIYAASGHNVRAHLPS